jgi:preprotein translocase subunit SecG
MYYFLTVLIIIVSILVILIVLVQNSKGGGLSSTFASSNQFMGVRKTADFLEKATWTLASSLLLLCVVATISLSSGGKEKRSDIEDNVRNSYDASQMPNFQSARPAAPANNAGSNNSPATPSTPKKTK